MVVYALIGVSGILVLAGIIVVVRGFQAQVEENNAVPIKSFAEAKRLSESTSVAPAQSGSSLTKHLINENLKKPSPEAKQDSPKDTAVDLQAQNQRLTKALKQEVSSKNTSTLSELERQKLKEKDAFIDDLKQKNNTLSGEINELKKKNSDLTMKLEDFQTSSETLRTREQERLKALENKLAAASEQGQNDELTELRNKFDVLKQTVEKLREKNQQLEQEAAIVSEGSQSKLAEVNTRIEQLKEEHKNFQEKFQKKEAEYLKVSDDLTNLRKENEEKVQGMAGALSDRLAEQERMVEKLKLEKDELAAARDDFQLNFQKIKEFNAHLLEKEQMLQYELTKSRAQTIGLERVCEDFKLRIEGESENLNRIR